MTTAAVPYRPLGLIKELLENTGFSVSHCYDDLIFVNHNAFLLRMEKKGEEVSLFFNTECKQQARMDIKNTLGEAGKEMGLFLLDKGSYDLVANKDDETLTITLKEDQ